MNFVKKSKVKSRFNFNNIQINNTAIEFIERDINLFIQKLITNCRDGNIKRLTDQTYHLAKGDYTNYL